ncbi:hypothetical protein BDA96_05G085800 [Sorghum bicolor]|uniref:RING-type E3 ubiquitin transferase n=1 Tax=Sorghum bicolor TaxID=4558 RepID=A0A921UF63_SORBI|nr:hypothetical protein BDA96_05G085800 [Sorghum bicolor]
MTVTIKVLKPDTLQGRSQFEQEVAILSRVRHPHLVTLFGAQNHLHLSMSSCQMEVLKIFSSVQIKGCH